MVNINKELTVIIPIWNDREHLKTCLTSIKAANNNMIAEVLIIDDGSECDYSDIIIEFDLDISVYRNDKNKGVGYSRKRGMELSGTEWITYIDSDDYILPDFFNQFIQFRRSYPEKLMYCGKMNTIEDNSKTDNVSTPIHFGGKFFNIRLFSKYGINMSVERMAEDIYLGNVLQYLNLAYDFMVISDKGSIYVWQHTNKKSLTHVNNDTCYMNLMEFNAWVMVKEFFEKYEKETADKTYYDKFVIDGKNILQQIIQNKLSEIKTSLIIKCIPAEARESLKTVVFEFADLKNVLVKEIKKKLKYMNYTDSDFEFVVDVHICLILHRELQDDTWRKYWRLLYNEEPVLESVENMQGWCDSIRKENAINAIKNKDFSYLDDLKW